MIINVEYVRIAFVIFKLSSFSTLRHNHHNYEQEYNLSVSKYDQQKKNLENTYKKSYKNFYYSIKHRNSNQKPQWGPCRITKIKKKTTL